MGRGMTMLAHRLLRPRLVWRILIMLSGLLVLVLLCFLGPSVTYCAVTEPVDSWHRAKDCWTSSDFFTIWPSDYVVRDGRLYLRVQTIWHSPFVVSFGGSGEWDVRGIEEFRRAHPELEGYWPDPGQAGGGVRWAKP